MKILLSSQMQDFQIRFSSRLDEYDIANFYLHGPPAFQNNVVCLGFK